MVTAWPVAGKAKSSLICQAFLAGVQDRREDASVFYGVDRSNIRDWNRVREAGQHFYYIDNSYFDATRGAYFRITRDALQHTGIGESDGARFRMIGATIAEWRKSGEHIVVCEQSASFMRDIVRYNGDWLAETISTIRAISPQRRIVLRSWSPDKPALGRSLPSDLVGAWALVTHSSAAAITALLAGIPTISTAGAAAFMGCNLQKIESPFMPDDRERFFSVLADNQWTLEEMKNGTAWKALHDDA